MEWVFSAYSHPGKVRKSNEDYFYIPTGQTAVKNLIMVADGMGGHNAGDIASRMVVDSILEYYNENIDGLTSLEQVKGSADESYSRMPMKKFTTNLWRVRSTRRMELL